jgi:serine/threonine protein kinase
MLNRRGCDADVVKVLDFGLVKAIDEQKQSGMTAANSLTGTPLYMAPEAIQAPNTVDARSDLYAVGAVGYFLLTGKPVFNAESIVHRATVRAAHSCSTGAAVPDFGKTHLGRT